MPLQKQVSGKIDMQGTIVVNAVAGRALSSRRKTLFADDVLDCAGDFHAGDRVHVVMRGKDGGQRAIAIGIVRCDAAMLRQAKDRTIGASDVRKETDANILVMAEQEIELNWPSRP